MKPHVLALALLIAVSASSKTYYIDTNGNDSNDGLSPEAPWKSIQRIARATFEPGDKILFKRGCIWRGQPVQLKSGEPGKPLVYSNYGEGELPIFQMSMAFDKPEQWSEITPGIWCTAKPTNAYRIIKPLSDLRRSNWNIYSEPGTDVSWSRKENDGRATYVITCVKQGEKETNIQFLGPDVAPYEGNALIRFRARCNKPFRLPPIRVMRKGSPWTLYAIGRQASAITDQWQDFTMFMPRCNSTQEDARLNIFIGIALPKDSTFEFEPLDFCQADYQGQEPLTADVGNIIFNHGPETGWKKWSVETLKNPRDYYHDHDEGCVYLRCDGNPATKWSSIEFALTKACFSHGGAHDVIVDGLHARYTGAHGFGGGQCKRVVIRNCNVSYIGGGILYVRNGHPTRYGNGIEFWCAAEDCLVDHNRIWQVYDVAISNQGDAKFDVQKNITYSNNLIWDCEQSYEYWRSPATALTENVNFVHNTCLNAGHGWSHWQRPNKIGTHVLAYNVISQNKGIHIRNNVFVNAVESLISFHNDWLKDLDMDFNLWWQPGESPFFRMCSRDGYRFSKTELDVYRARTGQDKHSIHAQPLFIDAEKGDYRLAPSSPGLTAADDGGPVGIR